MYLFFTLAINKIPSSDKQHFLFNILKNENTEEFLTCGTFCTFELTEKTIVRKWLSQVALPKVHLNKYGSYFKFILLMLGNINLNSRPTTSKRNNMLLELLEFHNFSFPTESMDYQQRDSLPEVSNDAWKIFQKRGMHFIHLNVNSLLSKTDEIRYIAKLTNATIIGLSEKIEGYDLVRSERSRREGCVVCFVKNSIFGNQIFALIQRVFL